MTSRLYVPLFAAVSLLIAPAGAADPLAKTPRIDALAARQPGRTLRP